MSRPAIAGLILAGGASRRMGTPKALLRLGARTFADRLVEIFSAETSPVIVVLGHDAELVRRGMATSALVTFAVNPQPERGMLSSLQCGLGELPPEAGAVIFSPVDYPNCRGETVALIAGAFRNGGANVAIPVCRGVKGHPVCISRRVVDQLLAAPATDQARDVIRRYRDTTVWVETDDPGIACDIDTPEDYRNLAPPPMAVS